MHGRGCVSGGACMAGGVHGRGMHGRGCPWQGACMAGDACGRGHAWQRACMAGGVWWGACMAGGMHGGGHAWWRGMCGRVGVHGIHAPNQILRDTVNEQAACILLECILVENIIQIN